MRPLLRRQPWPYHARLNGTGVMLKAGDTGELISHKDKGLVAVAPTVYEYSSRNPYTERTTELHLPALGMGERVRRSDKSQFYSYADGVDLSCGGLAVLGPAFSSLTLPSSPGAVSQFIEFDLAGARALVCAAAQKIYVTTANNDVQADWQVAKDLSGVPQTVVQIADLNGTLVVGVNTGDAWSWDGATATTNWSDLTNLNYGAVAVYQGALYAGLNATAVGALFNVLQQTSTGGYAAGVRRNAAGNLRDTVFFPAQWLVVAQNVVYVWKPDGLFAINVMPPGSNPAVKNPEVRVETGSPNAPTNGVQALAWNGSVWAPYGDAFFRLTGGEATTLAMQASGTERLMENASPVRGRVTAQAPFNNWFDFAAVWDGTTTRLCKIGAWLNPEDANATDWTFDITTLHGSLKSWTKQATAMIVSDQGDPNGNKRLYVGFADGTIEWCVLPRYSPFPPGDSNCRFQTSGWVYYPVDSAGFTGDPKVWRGASGFGPFLDANDTVAVSYSADGAASAVIPGTIAANGQRLAFPAGVEGYNMAIAAHLVGTATTTPILEGLGIHHTVRPPAVVPHMFTVVAQDHVLRRDGSRDWQSATAIRSVLRSLAAQPGDFPMIMPDGSTQRLVIQDWQEREIPNPDGSAQGWEIDVQGVQLALAT